MPDKKQFVLVSDNYGIYGKNWDGYYTGDTYQYEGEIYAVCNTDINKAKKYSSFKRAENAKNALYNKIVNYEFEVRELCPIN